MSLHVPGPGESEEVSSTAGLSETPADIVPADDTSTADVQAELTETPEMAEVTDVLDSDVPEAASDADLESAVDAGAESSEAETESESETTTEAPAQDPAMPGIKKGDLIEGTVIATSPTSVTVDVGAQAEGVIPGRELERMSREILDALKPGAPITVYVVNPHDVNGNVLLSVNRALEEMDWRKAEEHRTSQQVYESHVSGYNKGGLIVRFGRLRGFVPQSQISNDRRQAMDGETPEERWGKMVNDTIAVKVMEVDRSRNRLILSERAASREVREQRKESLIGNLQVGDVRTGRVVSIVDFGVFVDIGGAEGLVHLTELSWQHVTHPRDLVKVGQEVKVEVISVDPKRKRIGLSMKRQEADPWDAVAINYTVGQLVEGTITKLTKFGAFAQIADNPEIEGLIHISELSDQRVNHPREVVQEGDRLTLRVVKMDIPNRRLGLSLKRVNSAEYLDMDWR